MVNRAVLPLALSVPLALLDAPAAHALESRQRELVAALPLAVRSVQSCGHWHEGEADGSFRLVVADVDDGAGTELYIQWLRDPTPAGGPALLRSVPVRELNDDHAQVEITELRCLARKTATTLEVRGWFEHDATPRLHTWRLELLPAGAYRLRPGAPR